MKSREAIVMAAVLVAVVGAVVWSFLLNPPEEVLPPRAEPERTEPRMMQPATRDTKPPALSRPIEATRFPGEDVAQPSAAVEAPASCVFKIMDAAGAPIADARVLVGRAASPKTDGVGVTRIVLPAGSRRATFVAGAPRYRIKELPLPPPSPEAIEVRLERAAALLIRVRHEDPSVSLEDTIVIADYEVDGVTRLADVNFDFRDVRGTIPQVTEGPAMKIPDRTQDVPVHRHTLSFAVSAEDILVSGFKKDQRVHVQLFDSYGMQLTGETFVIDVDDVKRVEMVVRPRPRTAKLSVRDESGKLLPDAKAEARGCRGRGRSLPGSNGVFEVPGILGDKVGVNVSAPRHIPKHVWVHASKPANEVRLERARDLTVELVGVGRDSFNGRILFETDGRMYDPESRGAGVYFFSTVPLRAGTLRAQPKSGPATSISVGPDDELVSLPVPE